MDIKTSELNNLNQNNSPGSPEPTFNPSLTEDIENDVEKLKGDAIGDTLYSSRFVLSTLLKLTNYNEKLSEDEPFEKDLCYLWDMTIEKDVIYLLLQHEVLELFADIVSRSEDERMVEILIGIIGNMCSLQETRDVMCNSARIMIPILDLISCTDSLVLIQLMRLFYATLVFENVGDELVWFNHFRQIDHFVDKFAYILTNSTSTALLLSAFEALNAICNKFAVIEILPDISDSCFREIFVKPILIGAIIEAFNQMIPNDDETEQMDATSIPTEKSQKIMSLFLDINDTLSQYELQSKQSYELHLNPFLKCISKILTPLTQPIYLFPLTTAEQGLIETINELYQCLGDPFHSKCFSQLIRIWYEIEMHRIKSADNKKSDWEDNLTDADKVPVEDIESTLLESIVRISSQAEFSDIQNSLHGISRNIIRTLQTTLSETDDGKNLCNMLSKIVEEHSNTTADSCNN